MGMAASPTSISARSRRKRSRGRSMKTEDLIEIIGGRRRGGGQRRGALWYGGTIALCTLVGESRRMNAVSMQRIKGWCVAIRRSHRRDDVTDPQLAPNSSLEARVALSEN